VDWIAANYKDDIRAVHAGSVPFLKLSGMVLGGWQMARAALVAQQRLASGGGVQDGAFYQAKIVTARFFADHLLAQVPCLQHAVMHGAAGTLCLENDQF
jgi:butyryl-CoA dehydrogenase